MQNFTIVGAAFFLTALFGAHTAHAVVNSEYGATNIVTSRGAFGVHFVRINLANPNLRVYTLTATSGDCDQCATKPLASYVADVNGFAGIHGSYFCPADYPSCAGEEGSYFWLWYNTLTKVFTNASQNQFNNGGSLVAIDNANKAYVYRTAPQWPGQAAFETTYSTTLQALFSNGPGLMYDGQNVTETFPLDDKQRTVKGARGAVGFKGDDMYLIIASGATVIDLGAIVQTMGMQYAINLDGGGTSALWYDGSYKVGPGRNMPNAIVFAEAGAGPTPIAAPGSGFFAYDERLRGGFEIASGNVLGDSADEMIMGTGTGFGPHVQVFDGAGTLKSSFFAFDKTHRSGIRVAVCDVDGNGTGEVIAAEGPGQLPKVRIFSSAGALQREFNVLDGRFTGGVNVSCGDTDGNGVPEVIAAASTGGGPHILVYDVNGKAIVNFFAYAQTFRGGVNVTATDIDGDGRDEIITGPEVGAPHVQIFQIRPGGVHRLSPGFYAFASTFRGGVSVSGGDIDGDGIRELLVAPGQGHSPLVKAYNIREELVDSFYAFAPTFLGGVHVAGGDVNGNGIDEVIVVPRSGGGPQIRVIPR